MTYDEFIQTFTSYVIRDDAPISSFIARAEPSLRTVVKHYLADKIVTLSITESGVDLPSDFIEMRSIAGLKTYKPVSPTHAVLSDDEVGYFIVGGSLLFVGEPDASVTVLYQSAFPSLTASQSNWLFDKFSNVYLSAVLKEFYRWTSNPEGVAIETAALQEALSIVAEDDRRGRRTGTIIETPSTWQ